MRALARYALFGALLAGLSGCGFTIDDEPILTVVNECKVDAECGSGTCDFDRGLCVTTRMDRVLRVGIEVTPAMDSGGTPTTRSIGPFELDAPLETDLILPPTITVFGQLRVEGTEEAVPATITLERAGGFPGAPPVSIDTTTVADPVIAGDDLPADWAMRVVADREYSVLVEPSGDATEQFPPLRRMITVQPVSEMRSFQRVDIHYPGDLPEVRGRVVEDTGGPERTPVDALHVWAQNLETGEVMSSAAITGADPARPGEFTLRLSPDASGWVIRITGGPDRPAFPTLYADPSRFFPGETVELLVPSFERLFYVGTVGLAEDASGTFDVPGATLTFSSDDIFDPETGFSGSYRTTVTTDAVGEFEAEILPGTYEVLVTPPEVSTEMRGSSDATLLQRSGQLLDTVSIALPADGSDVLRGMRFELPPGGQISGTVSAPSTAIEPVGPPMEGAIVQADALGRMVPGGDEATLHNRSVDGMSRDGGLFTIQLDEGIYDLSIRPPAGTKFPWLVQPELQIMSSAALPSTTPFELSDPVPIDGTVVEFDGSVAGNAEIRAFVILETGESVRAVPIGRTVAEDDGSFLLLLPPML